MIPNLNDPEWYKQAVKLNIDRASLLYTVALLDLALKHPKIPERSKERGVEIGRAFVLALLDAGLIVPDVVRRSWEKTFNIPYVIDPDLVIHSLTDDNRRPWK